MNLFRKYIFRFSFHVNVSLLDGGERGRGQRRKKIAPSIPRQPCRVVASAAPAGTLPGICGGATQARKLLVSMFPTPLTRAPPASREHYGHGSSGGAGPQPQARNGSGLVRIPHNNPNLLSALFHWLSTVPFMKSAGPRKAMIKRCQGLPAASTDDRLGPYVRGGQEVPRVTVRRGARGQGQAMRPCGDRPTFGAPTKLRPV